MNMVRLKGKNLINILMFFKGWIIDGKIHQQTSEFIWTLSVFHENGSKKQISRSVRIFQGRLIPKPNGYLAGYGAFMDRYELRVPLPEKLFIISAQHKKYKTDE